MNDTITLEDFFPMNPLECLHEANRCAAIAAALRDKIDRENVHGMALPSMVTDAAYYEAKAQRLRNRASGTAPRVAS